MQTAIHSLTPTDEMLNRLRPIYDKFEKTQVINMNSAQVADLWYLHINKLGRSFDRKCGDCVAKALKDVFNVNIKPSLMGIRNQKLQQIYAWIAQEITGLRIKTAFVANCGHGLLVNALLSKGIQTTGIDPNADAKEFTEATKRKAIKKGVLLKRKSLPEVEALIVLDATEDEINHALHISTAKYIITKLQLDLPLIGKLSYISANIYHAINTNSNNWARPTS